MCAPSTPNNMSVVNIKIWTFIKHYERVININADNDGTCM